MAAIKRIVIVFMLILLVYTLIPAQAPQEQAKAQEDVDVEAVTNFMVGLFNEGDTEQIEEFVSPELVIHFLDIRPDQEGLEALEQWVGFVRAVLPDIKGEIVETVAQDDLIVVLVNATGTHTGEVEGIPASGNEIVIDAIWMVRVAEGQIVEWWQLEDLLNTYTQMGIIPPLGENSEE